MLRGHSLETQINSLCKNINALGFHAHKNNPERLSGGEYIQGEPYDYELFFLYDGGKPYYACFDAKECNELTWHMKPKDIKQAENLKHCKNAYIDAFFLVYFVPLKVLLKIDVDDVINVLKTGSKSIPSTLGNKWEINKLLQKIDRTEGKT